MTEKCYVCGYTCAHTIKPHEKSRDIFKIKTLKCAKIKCRILIREKLSESSASKSNKMW